MHTGQTALLCKCFPYTPNQSVCSITCLQSATLPILPDPDAPCWRWRVAAPSAALRPG